MGREVTFQEWPRISTTGMISSVSIFFPQGGWWHLCAPGILAYSLFVDGLRPHLGMLFALERYLLLTCVPSHSSRIKDSKYDPSEQLLWKRSCCQNGWGQFVSRTLLTNNCKWKCGPRTSLPACRGTSAFCFFAASEGSGPVSHSCKCHTCPEQLPNSIYHRQCFVFLFWKLEMFRKTSGFPLKFNGKGGGRKVPFCLFCTAFL